MKKTAPILLICLFTVISCNRGPVLKIYGTVGNSAFDGSKAYIIVPGKIVDSREDSAVIRNGKFTFTLPADSMAIRSIIIPRKGNQGVQELIFVKEPGTLDVVMSTKSHSKGTRLNGLVMDWKKSNFYYDSTQYALYYQSGKPGIPKSEYDSIMKLSADLDSAYIAENTAVMNGNLGNGVGLLLFKFYYDHLPVETRKSVLEKTGSLYIKIDKQVWSKVMFDTSIPKEQFLE